MFRVGQARRARHGLPRRRRACSTPRGTIRTSPSSSRTLCRSRNSIREAALDYPEQFVLVVVLMPDERPQQLDQFHLLAVQLADDLGAPVIRQTERAFVGGSLFP